MRRRSRAGGEPVKTRRRKTAARKRGNAPKSVGDSSSAANLRKQLDDRSRELNEALEQRTATAEVLKIISTSPTEFQAVLEVVVRSAARFCKADDVTIFELDGQDIRVAAHWGAVPHLGILEIGFRFPCTRGSVAGRTVLERRPVHVSDLQAEAEDFPEGSALARRLGHRTIAGVPLLREGVAVGTIQLRRTEVNPFTDKQIALLGTFADQAVIAIENARLLNELRESLEQQTATSEVLGIISSSPGELNPVFEAILENALRICDAKFGTFYLSEGRGFRAVAMHNPPPAFADARTALVHPPLDSSLGRAAETRQAAQVADERGDLVRDARRAKLAEQALPAGQQGRAERHPAEREPGHAWVALEGREHLPREATHEILPGQASRRRGDFLDDLLQDKLDELFLVGDVAIERGGRDPYLVRDASHRERFAAVSLDDLERGRDDDLPAELRPRRAPAAPRRGPPRRLRRSGRRNRHKDPRRSARR